MSSRDEQHITWPIFTEGVLTHFGPTSEDYFIQLVQLKKPGSLLEYQVEFESTSYILIYILQDRLVSTFVEGLNDELHIDVQS